ncbi:MAG: hypothetical protein IJA32_06920 [Lachnospiraceae bacterium]|nr:hypothetical protein [Lachnospiraceae bacterium]
MKIKDARQIYVQQQNTLSEQKRILEKKLEDKENKLSDEERGVILELSNQVSEAYDMTHQFLETLSLQSTLMYEVEASKQQGEAAKEAADDMAKCMEIARRISKGDKVPAYDEKKLLEYNFELYLSAKNAAMLNTEKSKKSHKSLWEDEEENSKKETGSIEEKIANSEVTMATPEVVNFEIPE